MSVAKTSESTASSSKSFEDAVRHGISKMSKSVDNIEGAWVKEQKVVVGDGGSDGLSCDNESHIYRQIM